MPLNRFRIWCKNKNEWESDLCALLPNGDIAEVKYLTSNSMKTLNQENHILEFSTGLKDKNNKEIYVGDIVRFKRYLVVNGKQARPIDSFVVENDIPCLHRLYCLNGSPNNMQVEVIANIHDEQPDCPCGGKWRTDGLHQNVFCDTCFGSKPTYI